MKVFPAIDLMNGQAARLKKGKRNSATWYGNPIEVAQEYEKHVDQVHIVDLDGAFEGKPQHLKLVKKVIESTNLDVQYGGGIRSLDTFNAVCSTGVKYPIVGTRGLDLDFIKRIKGETPPLTVSLDVREGKVATEGWKKQNSLTLKSALERLRGQVNRFVITSIERDGTLSGIGKVEKCWHDEQVLYAGGISSLEDVENAKRSGFSGVIIGKALYEGELSLPRVVKFLEQKCWQNE